MNSTRGRLFLAGFVLAVLLGAGCSRGEGRPEVAAVVEGVKIASSDTEGLIDAYLNRQKTQPDKQEDLSRREIAKLVLEYQIKMAFIEHLAGEMGVSTKPTSYFDAAADAIQPETYQAIGQRQADFVRELKAGRMTKAIAEKLYPDVSVSEHAVHEEYDRRAGQFDRNWKATAQLARFGAEEPARQVRERVRRGEPFEKAASALGAEGVASVDLNPVVASLPPNVLDAIGALAAGEVSAAIPTGGRWLAVLVEQRQDVPKLSFEDVRPELTDIVIERQRAGLFQAWFDKRFTKAKVKVGGYYGKWNPELRTVS